jgi:hypothetical protein
MREDTYFAIYQARKTGQQLVFVNFAEMQSIVEKDYETLRGEYGQFVPILGQEAKKRLFRFRSILKVKHSIRRFESS